MGIESPLGFVVFFPIFIVFKFLERAEVFHHFETAFSSFQRYSFKGKEADKSQGLYTR